MQQGARDANHDAASDVEESFVDAAEVVDKNLVLIVVHERHQSLVKSGLSSEQAANIEPKEVGFERPLIAGLVCQIIPLKMRLLFLLVPHNHAITVFDVS